MFVRDKIFFSIYFSPLNIRLKRTNVVLLIIKLMFIVWISENIIHFGLRARNLVLFILFYFFVLFYFIFAGLFGF